ncbi:MAG: c-type cytochrome [Gaiellaceae bacterium]
MCRPRLLVPLLAALAVLPAGCGDSPPSLSVEGASGERSEQIIREVGCGSCHVIPGLPQADGRVGPELRDFDDERFIAGSLPNTPENLVEWIMDPQRFAPDTVMPDLGLDEQQARDVAAHLYCCTG